MTRSGLITTLGIVGAIVSPPAANLLPYWTHNPLYGFGLWIPLLAAGLVYARWTGSFRAPLFPRLGQAFIFAYLAAATVLRLFQVANPDWRVLDWSLALGAAGALLALTDQLGGKPLLARMGLPVLFLLTALPWPSRLEQIFTQAAIPLTARWASELLWLWGVAAVDQGTALLTAVGTISVSEDCSGIRSLYLALAAAIFWFAYFRLRANRAVGLVLSALLLGLILNLLRVMGLVTGAVWSGRIGFVEQWHDRAGSIGQTVLMGCLPALAWLFRDRKGLAPSLGCANPLPKTAVAIGAVLWVCVSEVAIEQWYRAHEKGIPGPHAHWVVNRHPAISGVRTLPTPWIVRQNFRFSEELTLEWNDSQNARWEISWLDFDPGTLSACTHNIHRPEVCMPSAGFRLKEEFPPLEVASSGRSGVFGSSGDSGRTGPAGAGESAGAGGAKLSLKHQLYERGSQVVHLFSVLVREGSVPGSESGDWTVEGRLRAARLGLRSERSGIIHLLVEHSYSPAQARAAAARYLPELLAREQAKR